MQFKKDNTLRNWSIKNKKNKLCNILNILIPKHLPKIYLEGYKKSLNFINLLNWPKKPKFIFSSNAFIGDDIFKIYLAEQKRINKTKFISGQHGGGYFIYKNYFHLNHQSDISDYFITWGHKTNSSNKFIPMFNFYQKKINYLHNQNNGMLLIDDECSRFPYGNGYPIFYESNNTLLFKDRIIFLKNLKPSILKKVSIKLYPEDYEWANKEKYRSFNSSFEFIERDKKLFDILKNFKICVTNDNSTAYLQTLNANFPTVLFFNKKVNLINSETVKVFKILKYAGILFDTPEEAANKINLVWNSIDLWWKSRKVQYAVNYFCNKYSRRSDFQYKEIFKCFTSFEN
jgi:putative transferase (TIGR04331 family)